MDCTSAIEILEDYLSRDKSVPVPHEEIDSLNDALAWAIDCMCIIRDAESCYEEDDA